MIENIIYAIVSIISTIYAVSFGVWNIKDGNPVGGISVCALSLAAVGLTAAHIITSVQ